MNYSSVIDRIRKNRRLIANPPCHKKFISTAMLWHLLASFWLLVFIFIIRQVLRRWM